MTNNLIFHEFNKILGGHHGRCLVEHKKKIVYVYIPKNSSTWTRNLLKNIGWTLDNFNQFSTKNYKFFCSLRKPLDRWISGFTEYMHRKHICKYNYVSAADKIKLCQELICNVGRTFDEHTANQFVYLDGCPATVKLNCDINYELNIKSFLLENGIKIEEAKINSYKNSVHDNKDKLLWKTAILEALLDSYTMSKLKINLRDEIFSYNSIHSWYNLN